jgi:hypothetical protein
MKLFLWFCAGAAAGILATVILCLALMLSVSQFGIPNDHPVVKYMIHGIATICWVLGIGVGLYFHFRHRSGFRLPKQ